MGQLYANNVEAMLANTVLAVDTTITLQYPESGHLPVLDTEKNDYYILTLHKAVFPEEEWEVIKVTAKNGNVLTVERGQEGTTARSWTLQGMVSMRLTGDSIERLKTESTLDTVLVGDTGDILVGNDGHVLVADLSVSIVPPPEYSVIPISGSYIQQSQSAGTKYTWWSIYYDPANLPLDYSVSIRHNNNTGNNTIQYSMYNSNGELVGRSAQLTSTEDTAGITVTDGVRMGTGYYFIRLENLDSATLNIGIAWGNDPT